MMKQVLIPPVGDGDDLKSKCFFDDLEEERSAMKNED